MVMLIEYRPSSRLFSRVLNHLFIGGLSRVCIRRYKVSGDEEGFFLVSLVVDSRLGVMLRYLRYVESFGEVSKFE